MAELGSAHPEAVHATCVALYTGRGIRRHRAVSRCRCRTVVGECAFRRVLQRLLGHPPPPHGRSAGLQRVDEGHRERCPHGDLLLRGRARDQARARGGRAQRAEEGDAARNGGPRRNSRSRPDLLAVRRWRRRRGSEGLGYPDGDGYRFLGRCDLFARDEGVRRRQVVPACAGYRGRHRSNRRDRDLLYVGSVVCLVGDCHRRPRDHLGGDAYRHSRHDLLLDHRSVCLVCGLRVRRPRHARRRRAWTDDAPRSPCTRTRSTKPGLPGS